jgi:hypothetical protein
MARSKKQMETMFQLRGHIKELEAKIKELQRENKRLREPPKVSKVHEPKNKPLPKISEALLDRCRPLPDLYRCPKCLGKLESVTVGNRTIIKCTMSNYRSTMKND